MNIILSALFINKSETIFEKTLATRGSEFIYYALMLLIQIFQQIRLLDQVVYRIRKVNIKAVSNIIPKNITDE